MSLDPHDNPHLWELVDAILAAPDDQGGGHLEAALLAELRELEDDYREEAAALSALAIR